MIEAPERHKPGNVFAVEDMQWVQDVADQFGFDDLVIPKGSVLWSREFGSSMGGRCWCYTGNPRTWLIELSYQRRKLGGRQESSLTLAHELLHAWLWERYGDNTHGSHFVNLANERGIRRHCEQLETLDVGIQQVRMM